MSQESKIAKLQNLDSEKLKDVVKNYKQYGYDEEIRNAALSILSDRGLSEEDLKLSGDLVNANYERASNLFDSFQLYSKVAFSSYLLYLLSLFVPALIAIPEEYDQYVSIFSLLCLLVFLITLIRSFAFQSSFFKIAGKPDESGIILYFLLGLPFYFFMYFYFVSRMRVVKATILK